MIWSFATPNSKKRSFDRLRRRLLLLLAGLLVVLASPISASSSKRLFVFVSADMRAHALEGELERHLPGIDVTVFGRIRGFQAALGEGPDGVLARTEVLEAIGLRSELQGRVGSRTTEPYVLLSVNNPVRARELSGKTVGAVNIVGRNKMESFIRNLLGGTSPKLKYVTHERDLLALLQFGAVSAVVTSQKWANRFRTKSEMNLKVTPLSEQVGLPAVAFPTREGRASIGGRVKSAGSRFNSVLGVTSWR